MKEENDMIEKNCKTNDVIEKNCKTFEYCPVFPSDEELAETVVAFSNTSGGEILIHIGDVFDPFRCYDIAKLTIGKMCHPSCSYKILHLTKGKIRMISIKIARGSLLPVYMMDSGNKKCIYMRENDRNILIDSEDEVRIDSLKAENKYDLQVNKRYSMTDIPLNTLASSFRNNYLRTDKEELLRLNLIGQEDNMIYPTNALLAITGCLNNAKIRCSYCSSEYQEVILDSKLCEGDMMMQVLDAEEFLELYMPAQKKPIKKHTLIRHSIPAEAIREGLLNAVLHRDYSLNDEIIEVKLSDKALKIISPGKFPLEITQQDVQKGYSFCRNPNIARICKELRMIDDLGGGINRILQYTKKVGLLEPTWEEKDNRVELTLFRLVEEKSYPYGEYDLSDNEQTVITFLINHSYRVCTEDVRRICSVKERAARKILSDLASKECIEKVSKGPRTFYRAIRLKRQNPI